MLFAFGLCFICAVIFLYALFVLIRKSKDEEVLTLIIDGKKHVLVRSRFGTKKSFVTKKASRFECLNDPMFRSHEKLNAKNKQRIATK